MSDKIRKKDFILKAKTYIDNAILDPYIKAQVAALGYDDKRFEEGKKLQEKSWATRENRLMVVNKSRSLNKQLKETYRVREIKLTADVRLLKNYFIRDKVVIERLNLRGRRKRSMALYFERARTLYDTLLKEKEILDKLAVLNLTPGVIQDRLNEVNELEELYRAFKEANKYAQEVADESKKDFEKLSDWIRVFQNACTIALGEKSQLLEKVGILVRSTKPRRKGSTNPDTDGSTPPAAGGTATQAAAGAEKKNETAESGVSKSDNTGSNESDVSAAGSIKDEGTASPA